MKNSFNKFLLSIIFLGLVVRGPVLARDLTDVTLHIPLTKKVGEGGKQEAFDEAVETATKNLAEDMLGAEKVAKVWEQSKSKILKNSTKYVVFIKGTLPEGKAQDNLQVQMRLSPDALESVLREVGLIGGETVRVLPLVQVNETGGSRYLWWADLTDGKAQSVAQGYFKNFYRQLHAQFKGKNVFVLDPTNHSFRMGLPASYRIENLRKEDQMSLAQYLKADVVLSGRIEVAKAKAESAEQKIDYNLEMWQTKTGRNLAESIRTEGVATDNPKAVQAAMEQVQPQIFGEFATKLSELVSGGSLNLSVVKISVEGNLNQKQLGEFKKLLGSVREIRALRERMIESTRTIYEGDVSVSGGELGKVLQRSRFPHFNVDVSSAQDDRLVLVVKGGS